MKNNGEEYDDSQPEPLQQIYNKLPEFIRKKYSVIYDDSYKNYENIFVFKSSNEKWGALKYDKESHQYSIIAECIYDAIGFHPRYKIIEAVVCKNQSYSRRNISTIFNTEGDVIRELRDVDFLNFDPFGNIYFSFSHLYGLLDFAFEIQIPAKYSVFSALRKNLFVVKISSSSKQLLINEKEEIIFDIGSSEIIFKEIYNNKIIIKGSETYYHLDICSGEKIKLDFDLIYPTSRLYDLSLYHVRKFITVTDYIDGGDDFYEKNGIFGDGFITDEGKYGLINADGEICIPNIYDKIQQIHDDHFKVGLGTFIFKIDREKEEISLTGGKWGIVNSKNEIIVPIEYTNIYYDKHKNAYIVYEGGEMIGYENSHDNNYYWSVKNGKEKEFSVK
ncbi:hypothetical protein [Chryseobacterium sp. GP-SGM7]|uniref:hypothetical protein n=1 Tax=Chryseobacterium sp. GP-SGM7 TaxID=3411323 RepID=UPI003B93D123